MKRDKCNLTGKSIFETMSDAKYTMSHLSVRYWDPVTHNRRNRRMKKKQQKRIYYCEGCKGYHLTSQEYYTENYKKK